MSATSVYHYQSAREFVRDHLAEQKRQDPSFSIRRFARLSGVGSHALLVMILNGRRKLTLKQAPAYARAFGLGSLEQTYFKTLIQLDNARSEEERNLCKLWLSDLNPRPDHRILEVEQYHLIADWVHMAILTLTKIEGARITAENVYELISRKLPLAECRAAIARLLDLGLLREGEGRLVATQAWVRTPDDIANRGAREYHKQVSKLAIAAVEEQAPAEREFQAFAVAVPRDRLALAKEMIRKFRAQLVYTLEAEPGQDVYQCNLQFFRLTESPRPQGAAEDEGAESKTPVNGPAGQA